MPDHTSLAGIHVRSGLHFIKCHRTGKVCHDSRKSARRHLKTMRGAVGYTGEVYHCVYCEKYHIGRKGACGKPEAVKVWNRGLKDPLTVKLTKSGKAELCLGDLRRLKDDIHEQTEAE